jgi:N-glycosylase/DNA lyase
VTQTTLPLSIHELDLRKCFTSGQVFRFQKLADGAWHGWDGEMQLTARNTDHGVEISSAAPPTAIHRFFRLDLRAQEVHHQIIRCDPRMEKLAASAEGLRLLRPTNPVETLFSFLCTSNNHILRITSMVRFLATLATDGPGHFPTLSRLAETPANVLRDAGFGYRSETIAATAQSLHQAGPTWWQHMQSAGYQFARQELLQLPGIGPKLADCIALYAFDYGESVPIDTHLWQAITRHLYPQWQGANLTHRRYQEAADSFRSTFGTLSGWAHQWLFSDNLWHHRKS